MGGVSYTKAGEAGHLLIFPTRSPISIALDNVARVQDKERLSYHWWRGELLKRPRRVGPPGGWGTGKTVLHRCKLDKILNQNPPRR